MNTRKLGQQDSKLILDGMDGHTRPKKALVDGVDGHARPKKSPKVPDRSPERIRKIITLLKLVTAPSRQMILLLLADGEKNVGDICDGLESTSQPAVSHQLSLLRHGRLIEAVRRGRNVFYVLTEEGKNIAEAYHTLANSENF